MPAFFKIEKERRLVITTAAGVLTFAIPIPVAKLALLTPLDLPYSSVRMLSCLTLIVPAQSLLERTISVLIWNPSSSPATPIHSGFLVPIL